MKHKDVQATIELLAEAYPKCFSVFEQRRKPLKIGIHRDLTIDPKVLSAALRFYCLNTAYLAACCESAVRIDLNGESCGTVSREEEAACARERLEKLQNKYKRRQEANELAERNARNNGRLSFEGSAQGSASETSGMMMKKIPAREGRNH